MGTAHVVFLGPMKPSGHKLGNRTQACCMVDKSLKPQEPGPTAAPFGEAEVPKPEGAIFRLQHFRFVNSQLTSNRRNNKGQTATQHLPTLEVLGAYRATTPSCNIFRRDDS